MQQHDDEKEIIESLKKAGGGSSSMRVIGRGTLTMSEHEARQSPKYKKLLNEAESVIRKPT